ncbi:hypothetical protein DLM_2986 [Aquitalea magnusonii]|uniref:Uncharacterized protein n=1 Tax=Aquitalea magnusonii TaxID=332411 RepID=A0A3G9GMR0_9NEIS|nr:hypothetical protein DLM_2986 [Aquitalea magnusonii]
MALLCKVPLRWLYARGIGLTRQVLSTKCSAAKQRNLSENSLASQLPAVISALILLPVRREIVVPATGMPVSKAGFLADNPTVNVR